MARVAADAGDLDGGQLRQLLRNRERACGGGLAGAVQPDVELDEKLCVRATPIERTREPLGRRELSTATVSSTPVGRESASRSHLSAPNGG